MQASQTCLVNSAAIRAVKTGSAAFTTCVNDTAPVPKAMTPAMCDKVVYAATFLSSDIIVKNSLILANGVGLIFRYHIGKKSNKPVPI